jgi:peptidoglycan-N-acetylglucosamine deacetylase
VPTDPPPFRVAITFDTEHPDRPTEPGIEARILDTLARLEVRGTFFLQGRWVEAHREIAREIPQGGHLVGNHSFYHARMPLLSATGFATDVRASERAIRSIVGVDPRPWFRLPFGSGHDRPEIHRRLDRLGYRHVHWHADAREWRLRVGGALVARELLAQVRDHGDGAIVLLHSWPRAGLAGLEPAVRALRDEGATFVRVDELDAA